MKHTTSRIDASFNGGKTRSYCVESETTAAGRACSAKRGGVSRPPAAPAASGLLIADARSGASYLFDGMSERTKNNEESNETSEDHISALPDDLLLDVLSLLTADEAVQTCVLARRWRDLWRYLPSLSFVVEKPSAEAPTFRSTEHFNEFVNRLIALREPLPLVDCEIDLYQTDTSEFNNDETFPYPYLNQWIEYALTCQAQFLRVIVDDRIDQKFLLNVPLVSRHLMTLHLNNVDLLCSMDFSSCTPVLEDLEVSSCDIHARTVSSRSLKHLYIVNCHFSIGYRTLFSTPSLNSLHLAYFDGMIPLTESMPLLETAFVRLAFSSDCCSYSKNLAVGNCGDESCVGCFGYPVGGNQSASQWFVQCYQFGLDS